jgi:hypothetical protein
MALNFFTATHAHQDWKRRLLRCVSEDCNEHLDPALIALDNRCPLGVWLHSIPGSDPARSADTNKLLSRLLSEHAQFHQAASSVAQMTLAGRRDEALTQLRGGEYSRVSNRVIGTLGELYLKRREFGLS